jgi:hypothetical protein
LKAERGADTFVSSVAGSVGFDSNIYEINPGISDRNLALSKEAQKYDQYRFRRLRFRYVPSVAVTTTAGLIGLAVDPNANSSAPGSLSRFNAYEIRKMGSVYDEILLDVPQSALSQWKWTRCGPLGTDYVNYDIGTLVVASQDEGSTAKIGLVEVHYDVEFRHYHLEPVAPIPKSLAIFNLSSDQNVNVSPTTLAFDETIVNGLGFTLPGGTITLPCGQYLVTLEVAATDDTNESFTMSVALEQNDAALVPPIIQSIEGVTVAAAGVLSVSLTGYVVSDGTDTIRAQVSSSGATGARKAVGDQCRMIIRALT